MGIYLPELGVVSKATWRVDDELRKYDERLYLKLHPMTGDYCVYVRQPIWSTLEDIAVLGLGENPPTDWWVVLNKIREMDTLNHASNMLEETNKHNDRLRAERKAFSDAKIFEGAEALEYALRREGKSPVIKSVRYRRRW